MEAHFAESRLRRVGFEKCGVSFEFDRCELQEFIYSPPPGSINFADVSQIYRELRTAYQSSGKRHEAAECYYHERKYERRSLLYPYLNLSAMFPSRRRSERCSEVVKQWHSGKLQLRESLQRVGAIVWFHARTWLIPKYSVRALRFRLRYMISWIEELAWGYGEKP